MRGYFEIISKFILEKQKCKDLKGFEKIFHFFLFRMPLIQDAQALAQAVQNLMIQNQSQILILTPRDQILIMVKKKFKFPAQSKL